MERGSQILGHPDGFAGEVLGAGDTRAFQGDKDDGTAPVNDSQRHNRLSLGPGDQDFIGSSDANLCIPVQDSTKDVHVGSTWYKVYRQVFVLVETVGHCCVKPGELRLVGPA